MSTSTLLVAKCGKYDLLLDLKKLVISQRFHVNLSKRYYQLSMLEVLSFLDVIDQFNSERRRVLQQDADPWWMYRILRYIEESYLVKEIEKTSLKI